MKTTLHKIEAEINGHKVYYCGRIKDTTRRYKQKDNHDVYMPKGHELILGVYQWVANKIMEEEQAKHPTWKFKVREFSQEDYEIYT